MSGRLYTDIWSLSANTDDRQFSRGEMLALVNRSFARRHEVFGLMDDGQLLVLQHAPPLDHAERYLPFPFTADALETARHELAVLARDET